MLFNSYQFIFAYLPIVLGVYYFLGYKKLHRINIWFIGLASLVFYSVWNVAFLPILMISLIYNFLLGRLIIAWRRHSQALMILGLVGNIILLGYYKYVDFIISNINYLFDLNFTLLGVALPIGISFFTFTQIIFLVDCYKKNDPAYKYKFSDYLFFVTYFPHLVAGPILNHKKLIPQLHSVNFGKIILPKISMGLLLFCFGLFKKVMISDSIAPYVSTMFANVSGLTSVESWVAALLYTFQIYFDFSAYSDMALGLAFMMGIRIPTNFNSPYKSRSVIEFWRRWHMSLSYFLRSYLYISLGGNRKGFPRQMLNLMITMLLAGLWHGAGWTFIIWGFLHGTLLVVNHSWSKLKIKLPAVLAWFLTFTSIVWSWVFFRANSYQDAKHLTLSMFGIRGNFWPESFAYFDLKTIVVAIMACILWVVFMPNSQQVAINRKPQIWIAIAAAAMALIAILNLGAVSEFLYFQF